MPQRNTSVFQEIRKALTECLIFRGCSEFALLIKIQNTSISKAKRHVFNRTPNFPSVSSLAAEMLFFLAEVALSRTPQTPRQKHTSEHLFYKTASSSCSG